MASKSPTTLRRHSLGNLTLTIAEFSTATTGDIDTGDTWDSHIPSVVSYWANGTNDPTQNSEGVFASYSEDIAGTPNMGRFTFITSQDNRLGTLYILSRT